MKYCSNISMSLSTAWSDILKKEATGIDDCDLGEVQQIGTDFIVAEKGIINKEILYTKESHCGFRWAYTLF